MRMAVIAQRKMAGPNMASAAKARATITIARRLKIRSAMDIEPLARLRASWETHPLPWIGQQHYCSHVVSSPNPARV